MEQIKNIDGGLQFVSQIAVDQQIIYLDFDGEITVYRNDDLDILLDVEVENSGMTEEQKSYILAELSAKYAAENIVFTIEKPKENTEYSTVFIGKTDDFEKYGSFTGLAETIDKGNQVKNDNAFVLVDFNPDIDTVISVIDHEIGHIVEGMEHDISIGNLEDYAQISTHQVLAENGDYTFSGSSFLRYSSSSGSNFKQHAFTVSAPFYQDVKVTIKCTNIVCNQFTSGNMVVLFSDGSEYKLYDTTSAAAICSRTFSGIFEFAIGCNGSGNTSPLYIESYFTVSVDFLDCIAPVITDFYVSDYSYETATVRINATDSESNISKYYVQYGYINWAGIYVVEEASSSDGIIKLTDLNPNQTYYFFVAAEDENGNKSNFNSAGQKTFTTLADFEAPVFTGGLSYGSTGNNITLRWNAATDNASVAQYEINFNGTTYESTINSLTLNITPGVYNYSVTALDKSGNRSVTQIGSTKTVTVTGNITGSGTLTGAGTYFSGTQITVAATPDTHQLFVSLTVDGQDITGKTANITVDKDTMISAVFRPMEQYTVKVKSNFNDLNSVLTVTGTDKNVDSGKYYETSSVTFTAGDKKGYKFDYWLINGVTYKEQITTLNNISTNLNAEAVYSVYDINFNIPARTHEDDFIIGNLASIPGMPTYSITLGSSYTKPGVYKLIAGADGFNETIQVFAGTTLLGTLTPNGAPIVNGVVSRYLTLENGNLLLTIKDNLYVYKTESASNHVISGPYHGIVSGTLTGVSVVSGGQLFVEGKVDTALVSSGTIYVNSGGSLSNAKINTDNFIAVYQGGEVANTTLESSGWLYIDGKASGTIINNAGGFSVNSTGQADDTSVNNGGKMLVSSGGSARNTGINSGGSAYIYDSGHMENTNIHSGGVAHVYNNGAVNNATVHPGGYLSVYGNGSAANIRENGGFVHVDNGAIVTFLSNTISELNLNGSSATLHAGTVANNCIVNSNGNLHICGGIANNATINSGGSVYIRSGGIANSTIVKTEKGIDFRLDYTNSSGVVYVEKDGIANNTTLNVHGEMYVLSGGRVNSTYVDFIGCLVVSSGGVAYNTTVDKYGYFWHRGGIASNTILSSGGSMHISSGAIHKGMLQISAATHYPTLVSAFEGAIIDFTLDDRTSNDDYLINKLSYISGSPTYTITVSPYQQAGIYKLAQGAGSFDKTISIGDGSAIYGNVSLSESLTYKGVNYALTNVGGNLLLTVSGSVQVPKPADLQLVSISLSSSSIDTSEDVTLSFTIKNIGETAAASSTAYIYAGSVKIGEVTVSALAAGGSYSGAFTINAGSLTAGSHTIKAVADGADSVEESNNENNSAATLLEVVPAVTPEPEPEPTPEPLPITAKRFFAGAFNGANTDMLMSVKDGKVSIYANNAGWAELPLEDGWNVVGVGDFNYDHKDDILRQHESGLVIADMSNGNGTFTPQVLNSVGTGWAIEGTGDFNGDGIGDILIANPTAASDGNPDYPADQPPIGLLGYWKGGTEWTLINGYSPEWEMVATGDYNNDGKTDMLWRNEFVGAGGLTYNAYCTWIVDNANDWRMVSVANPDEWNFLCSGDFNADGCNDIALINGDGVVGIWGVNDGFMDSWSILSAVDTATWELAGVGDFNGDGTDDIAWCNTDSGLTGYWQIKDKTLESWQNIATIA